MRIPGRIQAMYWHRRLARRDIRPWTQLPIAETGRRPSVAIVGNAGYLEQMQLGERIDSHDLIVRMNDCHTAGFEHAVGSKVDLLVTSFAREIHFNSPQMQLPRWVASSVPLNFTKNRLDGLLFRHGLNIAAGMEIMGRDTVYIPATDYFSMLYRQLGATPTTGAMAILLVTDILIEYVGSVFITGFSFFEGRSHYYDQRVLDPNMHAMDAEKQLLATHLRGLVQAGRVALDPVAAKHCGFE